MDGVGSLRPERLRYASEDDFVRLERGTHKGWRIRQP